MCEMLKQWRIEIYYDILPVLSLVTGIGFKCELPFPLQKKPTRVQNVQFSWGNFSIFSKNLWFPIHLTLEHWDVGRVDVINWGLPISSYIQGYISTIFKEHPVENVIWIFSHLFDWQFGWFRTWDQIRTGNPIILLENAMEIPWLGLTQITCHVPAWKTNKTWINDMETSWNLVWIWTKPPPDQVELWR